MILGGNGIKEAIESGVWKVYENDHEISYAEISQDIGPNSLDVRLARKLKVPLIVSRIVLHEPISDSCYADRLSNNYILTSHNFVLGAAKYRIDCSAQYAGRYWVPHYDGRSTCGRLGLGSHVTAGRGDYGFSGHFTLELFNLTNYDIQLKENMRIGQISFFEVLDPILYTGAYVDQTNEPKIPVLGPERF